jgi:hypothetical protein
MSDDSLTKQIMGRMVDHRASVFSKIVLRAAVRAAIDVTLSRHEYDDPEALEAVEDTLRNALAMVRP